MTTKWTAQKLRTAFLEYFQKNDHTIVESSSVLPHNDPTLLFVNSGMVQFKPMFLNQPCQFTGLKRAASIQRCIRAGGKHNDLEDVGFDTYHHTFFEMMGNWSFGDYGKEHAIDLAFRFLTEELRLDSSRMYVSYYVPENDCVAGLHADEETRTIWRKYLPESRILPFTAENFWEMGDTGPCGPCTEIHYDLTGTHGPEHVNTDDPACIEIWNLVFMQFYRDEQGVLSPLDALSVDTGMGMERVLGILNGTTNYGTDLFMPLFEMTGLSYDGVVLSEGDDRSMRGTAGVQENDKDGDSPITRENTDRIKNDKDGDFFDVQQNDGKKNNDKDGDSLTTRENKNDDSLTMRENDNSLCRSNHPKQSANNFSDSVAQRIIADHARTIAVCLFYGVEFSSEGAGYVLRRITRRMIRVLHSKNVHDLPALVHKAAQILGTPLTDQKMAQLAHEHALFKKTLAQGVKYFNQFGTITAKEMFILKDTYGFPFDLTAQMCREKGIVVDRDELRRLVEQGVRRSKTRKGARVGVKRAWAIEHARTAEFLQRDYAHFESTELFAFDEDAIVPLDELRERMKIGLVADRTCFYSEKGGQIGDTGVISFLDEHGRVVRTMSVCDTYKSGEYVVHYGVINGEGGSYCCEGEGDGCEGGKSIKDDFCEGRKSIKDGRGNNVKGDGKDLNDVKSDGKDLKKVNGSAGNDRHSKTINEQDGLRDKEKDKESKDKEIKEGKGSKNTARVEKDAQALKLDMMVDLERRSKIRCNHTATHLLNHVLRTKYGSVQRGSLVADDRLRLDYTMDRKLENAEIKEIEDEVNEMIRKNAEVTVYERKYEEIRDSVVHLPDECYPEVVRIVDAGGARELCGGLHVRMLAHIRCFKIVSEGAISANTRRIIACTGDRALECVSNALKIDGYVPGTCNDWEDNLGVLDRMRLLTIKQQKIKESTKMRKNRIRTYSTCTDNVVFADLAGDKKSVLKDLTAIFHNVSKKNADVIVLARFDGVYPFVCGDVAANAEYVKRWGALHVVRVHGKLCGEIPRLDEKAFVDGFR